MRKTFCQCVVSGNAKCRCRRWHAPWVKIQTETHNREQYLNIKRDGNRRKEAVYCAGANDVRLGRVLWNLVVLPGKQATALWCIWWRPPRWCSLSDFLLHLSHIDNSGATSWHVLQLYTLALDGIILSLIVHCQTAELSTQFDTLDESSWHGYLLSTWLLDGMST